MCSARFKVLSEVSNAMNNIAFNIDQNIPTPGFWSCGQVSGLAQDVENIDVGVGGHESRFDSSVYPYGAHGMRFKQSKPENAIIVGPVIGLVGHDSVRYAALSVHCTSIIRLVTKFPNLRNVCT